MKNSLLRRFTLIVVALFVTVSLVVVTRQAVVHAASPSNVTVTLTVDQRSIRADQAVIVHVKLTNVGELPARLLKWHTPVDGVQGNLFTVTRDGTVAPYVGRLYKRPAPTAKDYITLQPGESLVRDVNLAEFYDLSVAGNYSIRYETVSWNLFSEQNSLRPNAMGALGSNEVGLYIEGHPLPNQKPIDPIASVTGTTTYNLCSATQKTNLISARSQASTYSSQSSAYLQAGYQTSLYTTWFGIYNTTRYSEVAKHFSAISNAMDTASIKFDCTCTDSSYAYVYPNQPYNIYLCGAFWSAPLTGTDSKAGTLIHEMSHFTIIAGTDDYVYGQTGAMKLAKDNPAKAIMNADNHEYFAENSSPVSLPTATFTKTATPVYTFTPSRTPTATSTVDPLATATYTPTVTATPVAGSGIIVNPVLTPALGGMCATGWFRVLGGGYNNSISYLTLNVASAYDSYNSGKWTPRIPTSGRYLVEAYIGKHGAINWSCPTATISANTARARYKVRYYGGTATAVVNQYPLNGAWASLGQYYFAVGTSGYVTLTDVTGEAYLTRNVDFNVLRFTWVGP
jgi:peptidyl-Lys metalloendopeptidase